MVEGGCLTSDRAIIADLARVSRRRSVSRLVAADFLDQKLKPTPDLLVLDAEVGAH
jgi:hypothetical protein